MCLGAWTRRHMWIDGILIINHELATCASAGPIYPFDGHLCRAAHLIDNNSNSTHEDQTEREKEREQKVKQKKAICQKRKCHSFRLPSNFPMRPVRFEDNPRTEPYYNSLAVSALGCNDCNDLPFIFLVFALHTFGWSWYLAAVFIGSFTLNVWRPSKSMFVQFAGQ